MNPDSSDHRHNTKTREEDEHTDCEDGDSDTVWKR